MSLIITFLEFFAFFFFNILSYLLEPELLLGMIGSGGDEVLNTIWRVSRDIMNIIFAFLLVVGAIITVITAKREYLAQYAVKFAHAVILVNF